MNTNIGHEMSNTAHFNTANTAKQPLHVFLFKHIKEEKIPFIILTK